MLSNVSNPTSKFPHRSRFCRTVFVLVRLWLLLLAMKRGSSCDSRPEHLFASRNNI